MFFFNDTATTEIYTLSLHDALPILRASREAVRMSKRRLPTFVPLFEALWQARQLLPLASVRLKTSWPRAIDRKSTRLNSSHANTSYAVFCLKKKTLVSLRRSCTFDF